MGHKMEANAKGTMKRWKLWKDGEINGEFDVLFPNGHYITGKMDRNVHPSENNAYSGKAHLSLAHYPKKGGPAHKMEYKFQMKDTNLKTAEHPKYDLVYNFMLENLDGKNILSDLVLKHGHQGEQHNSLLKSKVHGSLIPNPLEAEVSGTYTKKVGQYKIHCKYGSNLGVNVAGKYNYIGGATPMTGDVDVEVFTPTEKYKNLKFHSGGSFLMPQTENDHFEVKNKRQNVFNSFIYVFISCFRCREQLQLR